MAALPAATMTANCTNVGPPSIAMSTAPMVLIGGKPALTMGAPTADGGTIVSPSNPLTLVCGMPIAGMTAMHVTPMVMGIIPMVGGPVVTPEPTVLV